VNLTPEVAEALSELAKTLGTNRTSALHEAILTSNLLQKKVEDGNKVLVTDERNKTVEEVHLRDRRRPARGASQ
jgi:hypothetical protein